MKPAAGYAARAAASQAYDLARTAGSLLRLATNFIDDGHLEAPVSSSPYRADLDDIARTMEIARWLCHAVQEHLEPHGLEPDEAVVAASAGLPPWTLHVP